MTTPDPRPMVEPLNLDEVRAEFLNQCGPHDFGMPEYGCQCADRDYRPTMLRLVEEVAKARRTALPPHAERCHPDDWPAMAEGIATRAIREALPDIAISAPNLIARRIMADLVGADLLAVPGETRQEWGVSYPNLHPEPVRCTDEDVARHTAGAAFGRTVMVRTVHTGPWRSVHRDHS